MWLFTFADHPVSLQTCLCKLRDQKPHLSFWNLCQSYTFFYSCDSISAQMMSSLPNKIKLHPKATTFFLDHILIVMIKDQLLVILSSHKRAELVEDDSCTSVHYLKQNWRNSFWICIAFKVLNHFLKIHKAFGNLLQEEKGKSLSSIQSLKHYKAACGTCWDQPQKAENCISISMSIYISFKQMPSHA